MHPGEVPDPSEHLLLVQGLAWSPLHASPLTALQTCGSSFQVSAFWTCQPPKFVPARAIKEQSLASASIALPYCMLQKHTVPKGSGKMLVGLMTLESYQNSTGPF